MSIINPVPFYRKSTENYKFALSLAFTVDEVNRNSDLLPNKSLEFYLPDVNCKDVFQLDVPNVFFELDPSVIPNYVCSEDIECAVILTGPNWATSAIIGTVMYIYKSQQVRFYGVGLLLLPFPDAKKNVRKGLALHLYQSM